MKDFKRFKTIQLAIEVLLVIFLLIYMFSNKEFFHTIASEQHATILFLGFWLLQVVAFLFLVYDFSVYVDLKRRYSEIDMTMYSDPLTGLGNRSSLDAFIDSYKDRELPEGIGAITFKLLDLAEINKQYSNTEGDRIIKTFSNILAECGKNHCFVGRNGGNTFLALFRDANDTDLMAVVDAVTAEVQEFNEHTKGATLTFCYGKALHTKDDELSMNELVSLSFREAK